ncbi:MAG: hypothetical protein ACW98K_15025 [Candidatus Kariarchaeaceae archaeon]|jgi:hypothetical protein
MSETNNLNSLKDIQRVESLSYDVSLLSSLGEVITIQIDLMDYEHSASTLRSTFMDPDEGGLFIDGAIYLRITESQFIDYYTIFHLIVETAGSYASIDGVTALLRLNFARNIEIVIKLVGNHKPPQLLDVSDRSIYFDLMPVILMKWNEAKRLQYQ